MWTLTKALIFITKSVNGGEDVCRSVLSGVLSNRYLMGYGEVATVQYR